MELETYEVGNGEPLVFLGGAFTSYPYYKKFFDVLAKDYKIYFFNYPGFGKSKPFKNGHTINNYLEVVDYFIKAKKLSNYHLAGSSFGGLLATHYAHTIRAKGIKSLILFSPMTKLVSKSRLRSFTNIIRENLTEKIKYRKRLLVANAFNLTSFRNLSEKIKHGFFVHTCSLDMRNLPKDLPTLLVLGEKDKIVDSSYTHSVFPKFRRNIKIISFKDYGHEAFAVVGDDILGIVNDFTLRLK